MSYRNEPIAIVGTGCRFPGKSNTPAKLWDLLNHPRDLSTEIPQSRFSSRGFYHPDGSHHGTSNVRKSYFLDDDVRQFDSKFFNISTAEAEAMDPQQRMLLEVVYEAIESANLSMDEMRGTPTAVYVGLMCDDYSGLLFSDMESLPTYGATGAARSILSNRISYFFDWNGPSYTIDSACSSSLVAVHQGVQALRNGDCSVALAAGANLILSPRMFIAESKLNMLSPNGRCRMWDANGDGYARGEGLAAVVLKRLSDAIADGDPIECIIRETHVNQGGRSTGLTVPNPVAQVNLIRQTYAKAGLDLNRPEDRPQYFQAHGTGTKVGDLNEATAIHNTFFSSDQDASHEKLYIGSIKTIIGHSEGAAGIAGLLEASLAVQHGIIPPNLHFGNLNPKLESFYHGLEVPIEPHEWPSTKGDVRRASCNSFGFGGTNAHVILENYSSATLPALREATSDVVALPFVFSAGSERSLASLLFNYSQYLDANPETDLQALATTLLTRRSTLTYKISFTAQTVTELRSKLDTELERKASGTFGALSSRPSTKAKRILGVFTGQGAQWAAMGAELIATSSQARNTLSGLERCLAQLPVEYRSDWSLSSELVAPAALSRVGEAVISQPLCTAIQIILVDHLRTAGVSFAGVVGHSSGEIAAAYAAGFLSAETALKIAYLRGFFAKLAGAGTTGSMLAVGTSMSEAQEFCQLDAFRDRIVVAASNSSNSVTLSGDADAITEATEYFEAKSIFARKLKVDTAYHSHHMIPCSEPYLNALKDCDVQLESSSNHTCTWYSSVEEGQIMEPCEELTGQYWADNMLHPVLFSQALTASMSTSSYDFAIEVGAHPALKGPATQTLQEVYGSKKEIPYIGVLARGKNAIETFSSALGLLWTHFGTKAFSATSYAQLFSQETTFEPIKNLPTYPWDHERPLWYESRISRETRNRQSPPHPLLGITSTDQAEGEYKWRNYIRLNELPWLSGHQIQGQVIFPAAGYVVMALEAASVIAKSNSKSIALIEIRDLKILHAIGIEDDASGVETMLSIKITSTGQVMNAEFTCHACLKKDAGSLVLAATGKLVLRFGESSTDILPKREEKILNDLREVDVDTFYESLADVGYGYTGAFRGITSLQQKLEFSTGIINNASSQEGEMLMHPGTIDTAIQTLFACLGTPGDGSLWSMHVPVVIRNIRFNPSLHNTTEILFDAGLVESKNNNLRGDVMLYDSQNYDTIMQIEGIEVKPLMPATPADDRHLFHELFWGTAEPDAALVYRKTHFSSAEIRKAEVLEMMCLFYLKQLDNTITAEERENCTWHGKRILDFATHVLEETKAGRHKSCRVEWLDHTWADIENASDPYASDVDCKLIHVVGTKLIPFLRSETTILEHMMADGLLNSYYQNSELLEYNEYAGKIAAQIAFRYPLVKILEIGGGTGGATRAILKHLDNKYSSYTFTDISVAFFEQAQETFKDHGRIIYESLDIEQDPTSQGFTEHSYDLVIASNVLHATKVLDQTMTNVRKLLKPGGKLLVLEAIDNGATRVGFSFCGVPGWWAGADDGRSLSPLITTAQWDTLLQINGFSGIDTVTPGTESSSQPVAVFVTSAVDEHISLLRKPLSLPAPKPQIETLFLVGGMTTRTQQLVWDLSIILAEWSTDIRVFTSLEQLENIDSSSLVHVLNLSELDTPTFQDLTSPRLEAFKSLLNISKSFLWVTTGARSTSPYSSMALGIGRTLVHEMPHLRLQVLDASEIGELNANLVAEAFLRIVLVETWENDIYAPNRMWSNEPELWVQDGKTMITRVLPEKEANKRLMSKRRVVEEEIDLEDGVVDIVSNGEGYESVRRVEDDFPALSKELVEIKVEYSTSLAVSVLDSGQLYLVIGQAATFGGKVIALSKSLGSSIVTHPSWIIPWNIGSGNEVELLSAVACDLLAQSLISKVPDHGSLVLLEPEHSLAAAISRRTRFSRIQAYFITTMKFMDAENWIYIHPFCSDRELLLKLPADVTSFFDFSNNEHELADCLRSLLPSHLMNGYSKTLYSDNSHVHEGASLRCGADSLSIALAGSLSDLHYSRTTASPNLITARELSSLSTSEHTLRIVDWTSSPTLPVRIQSAESQMRFKPTKTYLLVGLSGDLGRSLCQWMILHGAKYIVLTSRNPSISQSWLDEMHTLGGNIKIIAMDISNRSSLLTTYAEITATLPPIAGVANAAMVLNDTLLTNMSFDDMQRVLQPKVNGSRYLDELFPTNTLDFFILFGSSVDVMGNSGQAAYCAANMFMNALVASRRSRGLAGSLIGLGEVKGVGYAARLKRKLNEIIGATLPLSETEVHVMFAEGVLAGKPNGERGALYAGMDSKDPRKDPDILWYPHPKFWHYIESGDGVVAVESSGAVVSVRSRLAEATNIEDVTAIVTDGFTHKLQQKLQLSSTTPISPDTVLQELGIDSLLAVDIRAWFVNELGIDMQILKILNGSTILDLVTDAVARLPATMTPAILVDAGEGDGVLVPNGLGGLDLIPTSSSTSPTTTAVSSPPTPDGENKEEEQEVKQRKQTKHIRIPSNATFSTLDSDALMPFSPDSIFTGISFSSTASSVGDISPVEMMDRLKAGFEVEVETGLETGVHTGGNEGVGSPRSEEFEICKVGGQGGEKEK